MFRLSQFDFHTRLAEIAGPVLVVFGAEGCGACRHLKHVLTSQPVEGVTLCEVDVGHDPALANEFGIFHLPALHLFVDGRYHAVIHAEPVSARLQSAIAAALAQPAEDAP